MSIAKKEARAKAKKAKAVNVSRLNRIFSFNVLWPGWECDSDGWIGEDPTTKKRYFCMDDRLSDIETLTGRLKYYKRVIVDTEKALDLLNIP